MFSKQKQKTTFSAKELESLGATTIQEALSMIKAQSSQKKDIKQAVIYHGLELNPERKNRIEGLISNLPLEDIEQIEIIQNGNEIKYHLSKTLTKDAKKYAFLPNILRIPWLVYLHCWGGASGRFLEAFNLFV